ncbi:MAG: aldo/keto reductase [Acidobacteriota bacterium]
MRIVLEGTDISTTRLGFGCAGLMRLRSREARTRLLETAFDEGIRHFDVARMYGLGAAEGELGAFLRGRRDRVVVATKFGISPGRAGGGLRRLQGMVRPLLKRIPPLRAMARARAEKLYEPRRYDAATARASLETSLRELGTDYVDLLLLHEPTLEGIRVAELLEFLDAAKRSGKIRAFGVAGGVEPTQEIRSRAPELTPVIQVPDDAIRRARLPAARGRSEARITFGPFAAALTTIQQHLLADEERRRRWSTRVDYDVGTSDSLARLLLGYALRANSAGVVLFSTTRPERVESAALWASEAASISDAVLDTFLDLIAREIEA